MTATSRRTSLHVLGDCTAPRHSAGETRQGSQCTVLYTVLYCSVIQHSTVLYAALPVAVGSGYCFCVQCGKWRGSPTWYCKNNAEKGNPGVMGCTDLEERLADGLAGKALAGAAVGAAPDRTPNLPLPSSALSTL